MENREKLERMFVRPEFRHALPFLWPVARRYAIVAESVGSHLETIVVKEARPAEPSIPVQEPGLLLSFVRLVTRGRPSNRSIIQWVSRYGLLHKADDDEGWELPDGTLNQAPMGKEDFIGEALEARSLLDLYTDLSTGGIDDLRKRIGDLRKKHDNGAPLSTLDYYFVEQWGGEADRIGQSRAPSLFQVLATIELESRVAAKLENVRPRLYNEYSMMSPYGRYEPTPTRECPDLLSAVYLQLFLWITGGLPMRRCAVPTCKTPFPLTRDDKWVCSPSCRSNSRRYPESRKRK